ncbi:MAG: hypothetical protein ACSHW0_09060 [Thalassotalea sp.]
MSEYEIVYMMSVHTDRIWTIMQFWASISFGLMVVAYIAAAKLTLPMISILTFLYIVFSLFILNMLKINGGISDGYIIDLNNLLNSQIAIKHGSQNLLEMNRNSHGFILIITAFIGTFISALFFLWYSYCINRNKPQSYTQNNAQEPVVQS